MTRYSKKINYFDMWHQCRKNIINCMYKNMNSDLECGYDPYGNTIKKEVEAINSYKSEVDSMLKKFSFMTDDEINHACYYDMIRRGDIE